MPSSIKGTHDSTGAGPGYVFGMYPMFFQCLDHTDMGHAPHATTGEDQSVRRRNLQIGRPITPACLLLHLLYSLFPSETFGGR